MRIKAKCALVDAQGKPIVNPKTKAPKVGFVEWSPEKEIKVA